MAHLKLSREVFQSTLPVRGGTKLSRFYDALGGISIHPPREGRDLINCTLRTDITISIHPPREGRDQNAQHKTYIKKISIHPPREGRDQ